MKPVTVMIVDDEEESRGILRDALRLDAAIEVVGEAASGEEAVTRADELRPQVVLMDLRMPGMSGIEATRYLTRRRPEIKVLALTVHDDADSVREMLGAGAAGYLLKGASAADVMDAVRKTREGGSKLDERVVPGVVDELRDLLEGERLRRAEAERLARSREEFIQILSHELRTPLTVIAGAFQLARRDASGEASALMDSAMRKVSDLERVIEGLELVGEGPPSPEDRAAPSSAVAQALEGMEAPDRIEVADEVWTGVRPHHLSRVARELVSNALRHGRRPVTVRAAREGREGVLWVRDAGSFEPGPDLLRPFVQGDMSTRRRSDGMGLGLFVASRLCQATGGSLDLRSEPGATVAEARFHLTDA